MKQKPFQLFSRRSSQSVDSGTSGSNKPVNGQPQEPVVADLPPSLPPSRSNSFVSLPSNLTSSGSTTLPRRSGVVNERQLDSLYRRDNHVQSTNLYTDPSSTIETRTAAETRGSVGSEGNHSRHHHHQQQQQPQWSTPVPIRRPLVADHNRLTGSAVLTGHTKTNGDFIGQAPIDVGDPYNTVSSRPWFESTSADGASWWYRTQERPLKSAESRRPGNDYMEVNSRPGSQQPPGYKNCSMNSYIIERSRSFSVSDFNSVSGTPSTTYGTSSVTSRGGHELLHELLTERDAELRSLRDIMERNEQAMMRVHADEKRRLQTELNRTIADWQQRYDELAVRAAASERLLSEALERLRIENGDLQVSLAAVSERLERLTMRQKVGLYSGNGACRNCREVNWNNCDQEIVAITSGAGWHPQLGESNATCGHSASDYHADPMTSLDDYELLSDCCTENQCQTGLNGSQLQLKANGDRSAFVSVKTLNKTRRSSSTSSQPISDRTSLSKLCSETVSSTANADAVELRGEKAETDGLVPRLKSEGHHYVGLTCQHCEELRNNLEQLRQEFDVERNRWLKEKEGVVAYQRLLQVGYVQLVKRCEAMDAGQHQKTTSGLQIESFCVSNMRDQLDKRACDNHSPLMTSADIVRSRGSPTAMTSLMPATAITNV